MTLRLALAVGCCVLFASHVAVAQFPPAEERYPVRHAHSESVGPPDAPLMTRSAEPAPLAVDAGPLALKKPDANSAGEGSLGMLSGAGGLATVIALASIAAIFVLLVVTLRTFPGGGRGGLPPSVFEVLGQAPLAERQQLQLVRCGRRLLLLAVSANGVSTLAEIDREDEVEALIAACTASSAPRATDAVAGLMRRLTGHERGSRAAKVAPEVAT